MATRIKKPLNFRTEINAKLQGLYLKALKTVPGSKAQEKIILEIDALQKLKAKFLNKTITPKTPAVKKKTLAADYKRPAYNLDTTGTFLFETKNGNYKVESYFFERANDKEDSLSIQEDLKNIIGNIIIKNSSWKNLSNGKTIRARSTKGLTGKLTKIK